MAITYFGAASSPADAGAQGSGAARSVTPPGSMVSGDLVLLYSQYRGNTVGTQHSITTTGGQSWTSLDEHNGGTATLEARVFWCQYNGTWAADPAVTRSSGSSNLPHTLVMLVFRPTSGSNTFAVDQAQSLADFSAAATITITGQTPTNASSVGIAGWFSQDDNSWGNLSGSGWSVAGGAQYRNDAAGGDQSCAFAHNIKTSAATQADVSLDETALGNDAGFTHIITFYESSVSLHSGTQFLTMMGCGT